MTLSDGTEIEFLLAVWKKSKKCYLVGLISNTVPWRVSMIDREILIAFLESPDSVLTLIPDPNWYLKVDQISPTLLKSYCLVIFNES